MGLGSCCSFSRHSAGSTKKYSPPSATKQSPKRMNMEQTETEDSDTDSSSDETTFATEIETNPTSSLPTLSQELELL